MADPSFIHAVHHSREQARRLRQAAQEARRRAEALMAHARHLLRRFVQLEHTAEPALRVVTEPPLRKRIEARRREVVNELRRSLDNLESLRMTPKDDPAVRALIEEIRKAVRD